MLVSHLKLFFRKIGKYPTVFSINMVGLSAGLACVLLIALWVLDELRFDKFHEHDKRLYQVWNKCENTDNVDVHYWTPDLLAETMAADLPEVEYAVAQTLPEWFSQTPLFSNNKALKAPGIFASRDYFNVFSYKLLQGNNNTVLADINSIVISEFLANKLFGSTHGIVGKTIECDIMSIQDKYLISGIFAEVPKNSTHQFQFILPFEAWKKYSAMVGREINWGLNGPLTYIVLKEHTKLKDFESKIKDFSKKQSSRVEADLLLTKYSSNYLYGNFVNGLQTSGRMDYVHLFSLIALFILLIACINYMNLSTASSTKRLKEIGLKKALGAPKKLLIIQYLGESVTMAFFALLLGLLLVQLVMPEFNEITGKEMKLYFDGPTLALIVLIVLVTGLLAGTYPAYFLAHFSPSKILRGELKNSWNEVWIRKGLVIFQFTVSIVLMIAVAVVYNQIGFIQTKNLGMDKDNIIYFRKEGKLQTNSEAFNQAILSIPGIVNTGTTNQNIIGTKINAQGGLNWSGKEDDTEKMFYNLSVGYGFIETMKMEVKEGRAFSKDFSKDSTSIIFNETAVKAMGLINPLGRKIRKSGKTYTIVGVLKDFHFESFHEPVKPMFFLLSDNPKISEFVARIEAGREKEVLTSIKDIYRQFNPGYVFEYTFLDDNFQSIYASEEQVSTISKYFMMLTLIISCLGLLGLAIFTAEKKRKEIGIRKVLGQSATQIAMMLSKDFAKLVVIAIVLAVPIAYLVLSNWLLQYTYRISLNIWYFFVTGFITLAMAVLTVGILYIRAAKRNPVYVLRNE